MGKRGKDSVRFHGNAVAVEVANQLQRNMEVACEAVLDKAWHIAPRGPTGELRKGLTWVTGIINGNVHGWVGIKKGSPAERYALRRMETGFYGRDSLGRFVHKDPRPHLLSAAAGKARVKIFRSMMLGKKYIRSGK